MFEKTRQACVFSFLNFNIYGEFVVSKILKISAGETLIKQFEKESFNYGLKINHGKTKVMIVDQVIIDQI